MSGSAGARALAEETADAFAPSDFENLPALLALLDEHPGATVLACDLAGRLQPWPENIPLGPDHLIETESTLGRAVPEDHTVLILAFQRMLARGTAEIAVRHSGPSDTWHRVTFFDVRNEAEAIVAVVVPTDAPHPGDVAERSRTHVRPRFGTMRHDIMGVITDCDEDLLAMLPWSLDEVVGTSGIDLVHPDDHAIVLKTWLRMIETGESQRERWRQLWPDGTTRWNEVTYHNYLDDPRDPHVVVTVLDVEREVAFEAALRQHEVNLFRLAEAAPVGVCSIATTGEVNFANDRLRRILGIETTTTLADLMVTLTGPDRCTVERAMEAVLADAQVEAEVEAGLVRPDSGEIRRCRWNIGAVRDAGGAIANAFAFVTDVTENARERVRMETDLVRRTFHDGLTGLPNRVALRLQVDRALAAAGETGGRVAVVLADLDGFKAINDSLGHSMGDMLLQAVADRLTDRFHSRHSVSRLGGDEFVVLLQGLDDVDQAEIAARQVIAALTEPFEVDGRPLRIGASVGIATSEHAGRTEELLRNADLAMYRAKEAGGGRFETFVPAMHEAVLARVELEASLRRAIEGGELCVHYQAIHDLTDGAVCSVEALARWDHPVRGLVLPLDFIPLAEETGLIVPLGRWVLRQACQDAATWAVATGCAPAVSVNLSGHQLEEESLIDDVAAALEESGLDPTRLILEVTESVLVHEDEHMVDKLHTLQAQGVRIAMDDFGTGYSSLSSLHNLPVDILKVDKSFIDPVSAGGRHAAIVEGILGLSRSLMLRSVAEGIETADQLHVLEQLGCAYGQGFLFTRPLPDHEFRQYLVEHGSPRPRTIERAWSPAPSGAAQVLLARARIRRGEHR